MAAPAVCPRCPAMLLNPWLCPSCGPLAAIPAHANPFQIFGITPAFELELAAIDKRNVQLARVAHPDHYAAEPAKAALATAQSGAINAAAECLKNPWTRAEALLALWSNGKTFDRKYVPPPLLLEALEVQEALSGGAAADLIARARSVTDQYEARLRDLQRKLRDALAALAAAPGAAPWGQAAQHLLNERKYYQNIIELAERVIETQGVS